MTTIDHRAAEVAWAEWAVADRIANPEHWNYSEGTNRMDAIGVYPIKFPVDTDCSGSCTLYAFLANGNDPNGLNFDHEGYTGTFLSHEEHLALWVKNAQGIKVEDVQPGDYVVYGPGTGWHVAIIVQVTGNDILTVSFGGQGGPNYCWVNAPSSNPHNYPIDGREPQTFLLNATNNAKPVRMPPTTK
jgi:hypothetical protein